MPPNGSLILDLEPNLALGKHPTIEHLRSRGAMIVDLRSGRAAGEEDDVISTDGHMGRFGQYQMAERLYEAMLRNQIFAERTAPAP